jgi:hypothetical protein
MGTVGQVETQNQLMNYCLDRRRQGWDRIIVVPIASWPSNESIRMAINSWLEANWKRFADDIVEVSGVPEVWGLNASANLTYFASDGHPNDAGFNKVLPVLQDAINRVLADTRLVAVQTFANGHVGIGLSSDPGQMLGVNGGVAASGNFISNNASFPGLTVNEIGYDLWTIQAYQGDLFVIDNTSTKTVAVFRKGGKIDLPNLPTAAAGLTAGQVWVDTAAANVLKRV